MPLISALSESRREGYFRREWRLAVERTLDMADDHLFLLPVVTDATEQSGARVPEKFLTVQWLRVPGGRPTPALLALCQRLLSGEADKVVAPPRRVPPPIRPVATVAAPSAPPPTVAAFPPFPNQEPGQPVKFWVHVIMWLAKAGWIQFNRLPRFVRILVFLYLGYLVISGGCSTSKRGESGARPPHATPSEIATKLNSAAARYEAGEARGDAVKLGTDIAREVAAQINGDPAGRTLLLAIPFASEGATPEEQKLADFTFATLYGRLTVSRAGKVGLQAVHLGPAAAADAQAKGQLAHARYLLLGGIEFVEGRRVLTIEIIRVKDGTVTWVQHYPAVGAVPEKIAAEVENHVPDLDDDDEDN